MEGSTGNCPMCDGSGGIIEYKTVAQCCGHFDQYGGCCNNPNPVPQEELFPCEYCEGTGSLKTCKDCNDITNNLTKDGICRVCWEMDNNPEQFVMTKEDWDEAGKAADYIKKHDITPNCDLPF